MYVFFNFLVLLVFKISYCQLILPSALIGSSEEIAGQI